MSAERIDPKASVIDTSKVMPMNSPHEAPVIYVDGASALTMFNGTVRFSLLQDSFEKDGAFVRKITHTLVFPQDAFEGVIKWLTAGYNEMKAAQAERGSDDDQRP